MVARKPRKVPGARAREHRTPRKDEILDVAAALFAEQGFDAVSLSDIAAAVGLSKATLYHYFVRKEEILGTIIVSTIQRLNEFVEQAVPPELAPQDKLIAFMQAQADFFEQHQMWFKVLLTRYSHLSDPVVRDAAVEWRVNYENTIKRIIQEGVSKGAFAQQPLNSVVRAVLSSLYWLVRWYRPGGPQKAREIAREYAELLLYGISASARPTAKSAMKPVSERALSAR